MQSQHPEGRNSFGELLSFRQIYACKHHSHRSMSISTQLKVRDSHVWMFEYEDETHAYWPWAEMLTYKFGFMDTEITGVLTFIWTYESARKQ